MSGIEVAGVVLAVLPLFISAWEHYEDGLGPAKAAFNWQSQLSSQMDSLIDQRFLFETSIEQLIAPVTSPQEQAALIEECYDSLWADSNIQQRIDQRLGDARGPFRSNMLKFEKICRSAWPCCGGLLKLQSKADSCLEIADYLDIDKDGHSGSVSLRGTRV